MTNSKRRKKVELRNIKKELAKIKPSPNSGTRKGYTLISQGMLAKHKTKKSKSRSKSKK